MSGINKLDIFNEIFHWLRGTPKTVAEPFKEMEDPEEALKAIWENLDGLFAMKKMTPEERMKKAMKRPAVAANDLESIIGMLSVLQGIWYEAKTSKSENGLNKDEIVQNLVNEKLGFMAKSFYKKQYKMMKTEPLYRRGFVDVIEDLQEEAQILKARGLASKPPTGKEKKTFDAVARLAPAQVQNGPKTFSDVVAKSPPKAQQPLPVKARCEFCPNSNAPHWSEDCPVFLAAKSLSERREMARKKGICFRCMKREQHIAANCTAEMPKCKICKKAHKTCFHPSEERKESGSSSTTPSAPDATRDSTSTNGQDGNGGTQSGANAGTPAAL